MKFYLQRAAFERESEMYTQAELQAMMPAPLAVEDNASGECRTPYGYVFPPFVIIERGQSLDEWARDNANKDFITIFQVHLHWDGPFDCKREARTLVNPAAIVSVNACSRLWHMV